MCLYTFRLKWMVEIKTHTSKAKMNNIPSTLYFLFTNKNEFNHDVYTQN